MKTPVTFAIAGFGDRGSTYASMQALFPDRMQVVAVADVRPERVEKARQLYNIPAERCFSSAEELLAQEKLADVLVVSTMDRQHVGHAIPALEKGYNILMEKPISPDLAECRRIIEVAQRSPGKIIVCHVLRYTAFYNTLKSILDSGRIGEVVSVCANENVGYWHQAHSFVRGNWRNSRETSPMILQKCCHDMDIYTWLLGKKCVSVSSVGSTYLFNRAHAPAGATPYCLGGCKAKESACSTRRRSTSPTRARASGTATRGCRAWPAAWTPRRSGRTRRCAAAPTAGASTCATTTSSTTSRRTCSLRTARR